MPWKETNIDAGALVALILGVLALGATIVSIQSWVDARIDNRVTPLERELNEMKETMISADYSRNRQYGEVKKLLKGIAERLE